MTLGRLGKTGRTGDDRPRMRFDTLAQFCPPQTHLSQLVPSTKDLNAATPTAPPARFARRSKTSRMRSGSSGTCSSGRIPTSPARAARPRASVPGASPSPTPTAMARSTSPIRSISWATSSAAASRRSWARSACGSWGARSTPRAGDRKPDAGGGSHVSNLESWMGLPVTADPLWVETGDGLVLCVGCCHAGLTNTLSHVRRLRAGARIRTVIGGFHLLEANASNASSPRSGPSSSSGSSRATALARRPSRRCGRLPEGHGDLDETLDLSYRRGRNTTFDWRSAGSAAPAMSSRSRMQTPIVTCSWWA